MESDSKIRLTAKEILEKDFKTSFRGYNKDEIDKYLDFIIKDYEYFQQETENLKQENERLRQELESAEQQKPQTQTQPATNTNYDILKRLSNLEKHVFGNKLDES